MFCDLDRYARGIARNPAISRCAENLSYARALLELPNKSVFAAAATDDEDFHEGKRAGTLRRPLRPLLQKKERARRHPAARPPHPYTHLNNRLIAHF